MPGNFKKDSEGWYLSDNGNKWLPYEQVPEEIRKHLPRKADIALPFRGFYYTTKDSGNGRITVYKNTPEKFAERKKYYDGDKLLADPENPAGSNGGQQAQGAPTTPGSTINNYYYVCYVPNPIVAFETISLKGRDLNNEVDKVQVLEFLNGKCKDEGWEPWGNSPAQAIHGDQLWLVKREAPKQ